MIGFGANRRGGRIPSFILVFLMGIIAVLSFNYWTVSNKHGRLLDELAEVQTQVKRTDAARSRLEKRNSELMVQVDSHRKQIDQRDGDYSVLEGKLQAREAQIKKCTDEKMKIKDDVTAQMTEVQRLKEQLKDLKQEFMKQEQQLIEVKKNSTTLEKKLEYESLQCGRQIAELKGEYEDTKKSLEEETSKRKQSVMDGQKGIVTDRHLGVAHGVDMVRERHPVPTHRHDRQAHLKEEIGKPGSDAGMPGIEDSEVGKIDEVQFALKKPAITQKHPDGPNVAAEPGLGAADGPGGQGLLLDQPRLQLDRAEGQAEGMGPQAAIKQPDKPVVFEENNKAGMKADELGERQRHAQGPDDAKVDSEHLKRIPLPPNGAQVPNPIQPQRARDQAPARPVHHRQNDEDRDLQGERPVDYGKRRPANDIL